MDVQLAETMKRLEDRLLALYTKPEARRWMLAEQSVLGGRIPIVLLSQGRVDEVEAAVAHIVAGTYI